MKGMKVKEPESEMAPRSGELTNFSFESFARALGSYINSINDKLAFESFQIQPLLECLLYKHPLRLVALSILPCNPLDLKYDAQRFLLVAAIDPCKPSFIPRRVQKCSYKLFV